MSEICSELTIKTPKKCHWLRSGNFIVNFEHVSHLFLVLHYWLLTSKYWLGRDAVFRSLHLNITKKPKVTRYTVDQTLIWNLSSHEFWKGNMAKFNMDSICLCVLDNIYLSIFIYRKKTWNVFIHTKNCAHILLFFPYFKKLTLAHDLCNLYKLFKLYELCKLYI